MSEQEFRKSDKGEWKYITGTIYNGRFIPMGFSKDLDYAKEMAKLHNHTIVELKVVEWL
jgi:hypothetical protein